MPPFFFLIGFSSVGSHPPVSERSKIPLMSSRLSKYQKLEICPRLRTRTVCRNTGARVGQLLQHQKFTFCAAFCHTPKFALPYSIHNDARLKVQSQRLLTPK